MEIRNKLKIINLIFSSLLLFTTLSHADKHHEVTNNVVKSDNNVKLLVLIIASDNEILYQELQKMWRLYMHANPEHVEAYFIKGNPHLTSECAIDGDVIWSRSPENLIPGITNKTIMSMATLLPRIKTEFNYVLRTNLSSFYVFPRLLNFLKTCPRSNLYCGSDIGDPTIGSGCGFLLSPDLVEILVANKKHFLNNRSSYDDVVIGTFLRARGVRLIPHKRMNFFTLQEWTEQKDRIADDIFHFRIKNQPQLRLTNELYIHLQLLKMFYPAKYPRSVQNQP